jgi:hypothetical protein
VKVHAIDQRQATWRRQRAWTWTALVLAAVGVGCWIARRIMFDFGTLAQDTMDQVGWFFVFFSAVASGRAAYWLGHRRGMDWEVTDD